MYTNYGDYKKKAIYLKMIGVFLGLFVNMVLAFAGVLNMMHTFQEKNIPVITYAGEAVKSNVKANNPS